MITIIPAREIMRTNVDNNIQSTAADIRRIAFDTATDLMSLCNVDVLIEGILYSQVIEPRLNSDQKVIFEKGYRIDDSAKNVASYNITEAIKWVAKSESKSRKVIIISENERDFQDTCCDSIKCYSPNRFIELVERARFLHKVKVFATLDDSLTAVLFY